ncbi:MAG: hypothetical protein J6R89_00250 [Clostridia bacterium]|nr:hypothetical protein [Clostridia bacterium]
MKNNVRKAKKAKPISLKKRVKAFFQNKRAVGFTALGLALCLLLGLILGLTLPAGAVAYRYGSATMREEVYTYYFACLKYDYMVRYKSLGISDTEEGWQKTGADGQTLEAAFKDAIEEELMLRLLAAAQFDRLNLSLSAEDYADIDALLSDFETYSYGESPFSQLKETYGIRAKRVVKQVALYEKKYEALLHAMFEADGSGVLAEKYRDELALFYEKFYYRYNVIFVKNDNSANDAIIKAALADGTDPTEFEELEKTYSDTKVTSGNYPNGIYLYGGGSYSSSTTGLDDALLTAMKGLEKVGDLAEVRASDDSGTYYDLRYALDDAPYLKHGEWVKTAFADLPATASVFVYRRQLLALSEDVKVGTPVARQTVAAAITCKDYNAIRLLNR